MKNQREIIRNVRSMSVHELLDLVVYSPFFLTDAYYVEIGKAVRSRYAELKERVPGVLLISKKLRSTGPPGLWDRPSYTGR